MSVIKQSTLVQLCEFFLHLSKIETEAEIIRQLLCEFKQFHPYILFKIIDEIGGKPNGQLTPQDILLFLEEYGKVTNLEECKHYIDLYSEDENGILLYSEFLRAVLPQSDGVLRQQITMKSPERQEKIDDQICYTFAKLIHNEILNMSETSYYIERLELCSDYNCIQFFRTLDRYQTGRLLLNDFKEFFTNAAIIAYDEEIECMFRKIDLMNDGIVDQTEFKRVFKKRISTSRKTNQLRQIVTPLKNSTYLQRYQERSSSKSKSKKNQYSDKSYSSQIDKSKYEGNSAKKSPIKKLQMSRSILKTSPAKSSIQRSVSFKSELKESTVKKKDQKVSNISSEYYYQTPQKKYMEQKTDLRAQMQLHKLSKTSAKQQRSTPKTTRPLSKSCTFSLSVYFCEVLNQIIEMEKDIEKIKIELTSQPEFNLCDAFRFLDTQKWGYLKITNFEHFLPKGQLNALFKRYSIDKSKMSFSQFITLLEPCSQDYQEYLHKKEGINNKTILQGHVGEIFKRLLLAINNEELSLEQIRIDFKKKPQANIKELFQLLDYGSKDNIISLKDLDEFFYARSLQPDILDLQLLFNRLDMDMDGKIGFSDFIQFFAF